MKEYRQRDKIFTFCTYLLEQWAGNDIGTGSDQHLNNFFWIQNIPNVATNNINIWFLTHNTFSDEEKLDLIVLLIA